MVLDIWQAADMQELDIIGDVHGSALKLEALLHDLGYRINPWSGAYRHKTRHAIFVGDLIDRGPSQMRVLEIVKAMVDDRSADIVMGNHEFNALAYATDDPRNPPEQLRPHGPKNDQQHEAFLSQLTKSQQALYLAWFRTFPLWLDLGKVRIVHACWHDPSIRLIEKILAGNVFTDESQIVRAARKSSSPVSLYQAVEVVLKGPELELARYGVQPFEDPDGNSRLSARVKWWKGRAKTLGELVDVPTESLTTYGGLPGDAAGALVTPRDRSFSYGDKVPVFYGHYWRSGQPMEHEDWTERTACVDFSAVKGGTMVAYRWSGEGKIDRTHYHPHPRDVIAPAPSQ